MKKGNIHYQIEHIYSQCVSNDILVNTDIVERCCQGEISPPKGMYECALHVLEDARDGKINIDKCNLRTGKKDSNGISLYDPRAEYKVGQRIKTSDGEAIVVSKLPKQRMRVRYKDNRRIILPENIREYKATGNYNIGEMIFTEHGIGAVIEKQPHDMMTVRLKDRRTMQYRERLVEYGRLYSRDESPFMEEGHKVILW